jgi:hypothetical protein
VEQAALEARVVALREERDRLTRALDDAPLLRGLAELERRRRGRGAPIDLRALGGLPLVDPEALGGEIAQLEQEASEPAARLARAPEVLSEQERALQGALAEIDAALAGLPAQRAERERFAESKQRAAGLEDAVRRELASVLAHEPGDVEIEAARAVPCEALRAAQSAWAAACEQPANRLASRAPRAWLLASAAATAVALARSSSSRVSQSSPAASRSAPWRSACSACSRPCCCRGERLLRPSSAGFSLRSPRPHRCSRALRSSPG